MVVHLLKVRVEQQKYVLKIDYSTKQQLLQKVEDIKREFEKCSKLISTQKNEGYVQPSIDEKKKFNRAANKISLKERNCKHLKKDYLNCTPVIQVEICNEEQSPFRKDNGGKCLAKNNEKEKIIRKSLTRIIEKNIRNPSTEKSTERRKISNLKTQSSIKSPLNHKNKESESLTRSSTINEPKSRRYLERIKNQFNQSSKQVPLTSRHTIFDSILPNRSKSFFTSPRGKCLDRKTMNHESKFGREAFISSPRGQELMRKYQGKYKMVNLDTSCSISRNSSKSARENPFIKTKKVNSTCKLNTTNAKEFREILRQSVQSKQSESLIQHFESEKEVKMHDLDLDFSSRKESLITKHEENSDHNCDRSNKDIAPKLDISNILVTPNNSEKKIARHMRSYLDRSSMKTNQPKYRGRCIEINFN